MRKLFLSTFVILFFLTSCNTVKLIKLMKSGEVEQKEFKVEVPFEYRLGLVIIKVNIQGETYDFLLDTGAPNVLSQELAQKLELEYVSEKKVSDSEGENSKLGFARIEKMGIGGIDFLDTGAAIADLGLSEGLACLQVAGFIGSNLMNSAIWKLDYQNQTLTITNALTSLNIPSTVQKIPFSQGLGGKPTVDLSIDDIVEEGVVLDLGSNGDISLSKKTLNKLMKYNSEIPQTYSFGNSSAGLYGSGKGDKTFYAKVPVVSFGDVALENTILKFSKNNLSTIGTEFFKNYDVIFNWFTSELILLQQKEYDNSSLSNFGFSYSLQENRLYVSELFENMETLQRGDQILQIDEVSYKEISQAQWCELLGNGYYEEGTEEISIRVLREGKELAFTLKKINYL